MSMETVRAALITLTLMIALFGTLFWAYGLPPRKEDWLIGLALAIPIAGSLYLIVKLLLPYY